MRKLRLVLLLLMLCLIFTPCLMASVDTLEDGTRVDQATHLNFTGQVNLSSDGSTVTVDIGPDVTFVSDASRTITTAESGTIFVATGNSATTFILPPSEAGLEYGIVDGGGAAPRAVNVDVDTPSGDRISYLSGTILAGDKITSASSSGDSVRLAGSDSGIWYVIDTGDAAWTDGN